MNEKRPTLHMIVQMAVAAMVIVASACMLARPANFTVEYSSYSMSVEVFAHKDANGSAQDVLTVSGNRQISVSGNLASGSIHLEVVSSGGDAVMDKVFDSPLDTSTVETTGKLPPGEYTVRAEASHADGLLYVRTETAR